MHLELPHCIVSSKLNSCLAWSAPSLW